ncbi:MAG: hypothetical protein MJ061_05810, partial [Mailhella sp.]|nr:hypothetical protein [Mailhella sp.]
KTLARRAAATAALILLANLRAGTGPEGLGFARLADSVRNELSEKLLSNSEAEAFRTAESAQADRIHAFRFDPAVHAAQGGSEAAPAAEAGMPAPVTDFGGWAGSLLEGRDDGGRGARLLRELASMQSRLLAIGTEPEGMDGRALGIDEDELHEIGLILESALLARGSLLSLSGLPAAPAPDGSDPDWLELAGFTCRGPLAAGRLAEITARLDPLMGGCLWYRFCRGVRLLEAGEPAAASHDFAAGTEADLFIDGGMPFATACAAGLILCADSADDGAPAEPARTAAPGAVRCSEAYASRLLYALERSLVPAERDLAALLFALRSDMVRACDIMRNPYGPSNAVHEELRGFLGITEGSSAFARRGQEAEKGGVLAWLRRTEELAAECCMEEAFALGMKAAATGFAPAVLAAMAHARFMGRDCDIEAGDRLADELEKGAADISSLGPLAAGCADGVIPDDLARYYHGIAVAEAAAWRALTDPDRARRMVDAALAENPGSCDLRELKFSMMLDSGPYDEAAEIYAGLQADGFDIPRMLRFSLRRGQGLPVDDLISEGAEAGEPMSLVFEAKRLLANIPSAATRRKALDMLRRSAGEGCTVAMEILAQMTEDAAARRALLTSAMERGSLSAAAELAKELLFHGNAEGTDAAMRQAGLKILEDALGRWEGTAGHGSCRALYAALLLSGDLIPQDTERGMAMLEGAGDSETAKEVRAAYGPLAPEKLQGEIDRGNPEAMVRAAEILSDQDDADMETVFRLLAGAAERGSLHARYLIAEIMLRHADTEEEFLKHAAELRDCALAGSAEAVKTSSLLLRMGRCAFTDEQKRELGAGLEDLAAAGEAEAMYELGMALADGSFLPKDPDRAFRLLMQAAEEGVEPAAYEIALRLAGDRSPEGRSTFRRMLA